jgi:hypothetical protein
MSDREIYRITVPETDITHNAKVYDQIAEEYRVDMVPSDDVVSCIIYGRYKKRWMPNVFCRWLVRHLIEELNEAVEALRLLDEAGAIPQLDSLTLTPTKIGTATKLARAVLAKRDIKKLKD